MRVDAVSLLEAAMAPRTLRAYKGWIQGYQDYCKAAKLDPYAIESVGAWLESLSQRHKISSIEQAAAAIRFLFRVSGRENPMQAEPLRLLMRALKRRLGTAKRQVQPLTLSEIALIQWDEGAKGERDKALILVGFAGALRVSELTSLNVSDLGFSREGVILTIRKSKTDQAGKGRQVAIPYADNPSVCPVRALEAYLAIRGRWEGPLFVSIHNGRLTKRRITPVGVRNIVKDYADRLGLDWREFSSHSLRAGLATTAALMGASEGEIASQTGHKSLEVVATYIRRANLFQRNVASRILRADGGRW